NIQLCNLFLCFFSSRRRHTRSKRDWSSDVCSSDLRSSLSWKFWFSPSGNVLSILTFMECGLGVGSIETIFIFKSPLQSIVILDFIKGMADYPFWGLYLSILDAI